jgi:hypothetical protein
VALLPFEIETGYRETLPWGAWRVAGRNRPDTLSNPSYRDVQIKLLSPAEVSTWLAFYRDTIQDGSIPFQVGSDTVQIIGQPAYSQSNGVSATVSMRLEYDAPIDYCNMVQLASIGAYFGAGFDAGAAALDDYLNGP